MKNFDLVRTFEDGYSTDLTNNIEKKNTMQKAVNGRLYSVNGVLKFNAIEGSKLVYQNSSIVKYLGYYSFRDEFIVFAKAIKSETNEGTTTQVCDNVISAISFSLNKNSIDDNTINLTDELSENSNELENCYFIQSPSVDETDFDLNYSDEIDNNIEIDFGEYYGVDVTVPNFDLCNIDNDIVPINNLEYDDCIYSFKLNDNFNLSGTLLWIGQQNWPINGKITTEGVEENEFYKRVYYTDALNPRRVVNIKDTSLVNRSGNEFDQVLTNILLQPRISEIVDGGQLSAMKVLYVYRIISENGQLSEFSPASEYAVILIEDEPVRYRGGDISEASGKSVKITCNIIDANENSEVQCIAVEYEAFGSPTAIRNLGRKSARNIVEFQHYGNEDEFSDDITFNDLVDSKNTWKYCNDFTSKKNKLIAGGLRNDPIPTEINNLEYLFPLHSWKENGETHKSLINPKPWEYRFIDPTNTDSLIYIKRKVYQTISSFGPLTLTLKNKNSSEEITETFSDLNIQSYTSIINDVSIWLILAQAEPTFSVKFPNLSITNVNGKLLFSPIDENIETDMSDYIFSSNNNQFIENFDNDIQFVDVSINTSNLVYGAQSIGFNDGIGLRVTYREFKRPLLNKANKIYDGTGKLLDFEKPTGEKFCMKGELYRLAFQAYDNDSTRYFSIPLGDVLVPNIGELRKEIDDTGNLIITSESYLNQSVVGDVLYGHGIKMHIEVRLSCELQKVIPMYQILYVERTEENRTILCQGISAPLNRVQDTGSNSHRMPDEVRNKWNLPYYGGPTYEIPALSKYDENGENYNTESESNSERVIAHRGLMYFDSPDLYYNKISDQFVDTSIINIVGKLKTDHTPSVIRERGTYPSNGSEIYPKFSRKILEDQIEGNNHSDDLPRRSKEDRESGSYETHFINVSVYSNYISYNKNIQIDKSETLIRGEEISGSAFGLSNDVSNNTFCLPNQPWYYGSYQRKWQFQSDRANSVIFSSATVSPGYKTTVIKTTEDLFTSDFIGPSLPNPNSQIRLGGSNISVADTLPVINIFRNNRESVFGGRSKEAFSRNTYIPLTETIPTLKSSNGSQFFDVGADVYVTLNIRTKNDYGDSEIIERDMNNHGGARAKGDIKAWKRNGAWCYVVVLETQVEPKWTYQYEFYKENGTHNFEALRAEIINEAYFNENTLKTYIPKPFKFKDDPNQENVIAVSDVKLAGELYDSWTSFKTNNFYAELEKNKGAISNLLKEKDKIFAIQEQQTSLIYIGTERLIQDSEGKPINLQQGSGTVVDGHEVISNYGTSIRRATIGNTDYGFSFFDEKKNEFIKINKPLLLNNLLHLNYNQLFKKNPVIDTEIYFDHAKKETNINLKLKDGTGYLLSYNEVLKKFNGEHEYNNNLYVMFDEKIYIPILNKVQENISSENLHQLNEGDVLSLSGEQKELVIGIIVNSKIDMVFQYKSFGAITDLAYPLKSILFSSNIPGYDRTILGTHNWYKIREGNHTVPAINDSNDFYGNSDIRGNQIYVEVTAESINKSKVSILAILNSLRISHQ